MNTPIPERNFSGYNLRELIENAPSSQKDVIKELHYVLIFIRKQKNDPTSIDQDALT